MGYIKDLRRLGAMKCAKCHKATPGSSSKDLECAYCEAKYDRDCAASILQPISSKRTFLGKTEIVHHEFVCMACGKKNVWHDAWRSFLHIISSLSSRECNCSG